MTAQEILDELKALGSETTKRTLMKHGAPEPFWGVKIGDMKPIVKRVKVNHELALALYDSGVSDAMYLAGLIADDAKMTPAQLRRWAKQAPWYMIGEYTVAWVASGSPHGQALGLEWIDSKKSDIASVGWATLASLVSIQPDETLDLDLLRRLLDRVVKTIHDQPGRVPYTMNGFVIAVGAYVKSLTPLALEAAAKIGKVEVDMRGTDCKVPSAAESIRKVMERGTLGKKRKSAKC